MYLARVAEDSSKPVVVAERAGTHGPHPVEVLAGRHDQDLLDESQRLERKALAVFGPDVFDQVDPPRRAQPGHFGVPGVGQQRLGELVVERGERSPSRRQLRTACPR